MKNQKYHIRKNDNVMVVSGKEKGKSGKVLRIHYKKDRAIVEKVNFMKRHSRPSQGNRQGGIIEKEAPIHISNLMVVCEKCSQPVRIGKMSLEDGRNVRTCKRCGEILDK